MTIEEIDELVKDYPFKLPIEVYELYQRANGYALTIGKNRDYNSLLNYFPYPEDVTAWYTLEETMRIYKSCISCREYDRLEDSLLILFSNEIYSYGIKGSKEQKEVSPIFQINQCLELSLVCPSVTNVMLAQMEIMEQQNMKGQTFNR